MESDGCSDDKLNINLKSGKDDEKPSPAKRKRPSSAVHGPTRKRHKCHLEQMSSRQQRSHFELHRHYSKSHSPSDQSLRVAVKFCGAGPLPSPAPSTPQATNMEMPFDYSDLGGSSRSILPTLLEVTFCPQSSHCCSFIAVIRNSSDRRGVSFSQVARLIESTSHVGKIDDFTTKPIKQHLFLVTDFSQHAPSRLLSSRTTVFTAAEASPILDDTPSIIH